MSAESERGNNGIRINLYKVIAQFVNSKNEHAKMPVCHTAIQRSAQKKQLNQTSEHPSVAFIK